MFRDIYGDKFKDLKELHKLIQEYQDEGRKIANLGLTNLGYFMGDFTIHDGWLPPIIDEIIVKIPQDKISQPLEERLFRMLKRSYSPKFNQNTQLVLDELQSKIGSSQGKVKSLYENLYQHYKDVIELGEELKNARIKTISS